MNLEDYIYTHYRNNKTAFANAIGRSPQMVAHYIKQGYTVDNGRLIEVKITLPAIKQE